MILTTAWKQIMIIINPEEIWGKMELAKCQNLIPIQDGCWRHGYIIILFTFSLLDIFHNKITRKSFEKLI